MEQPDICAHGDCPNSVGTYKTLPNKKRIYDIYCNSCTNDMKAELHVPTREYRPSKIVVEISDSDLVYRIRQHVRSRGAPKLPNGIWALMLAAAARIETLTRYRR